MSLSRVYRLATPTKTRQLKKEHRKALVDGSGLLPGVVKQRGYYSLEKSNVQQLISAGALAKFALGAESWMGIPITRPDGKHHGDIIRLFGAKSTVPKYVWPKGIRNALDIHPAMLDLINDKNIPLVFIEGVKKEDAVLTRSLEEDLQIVPVGLSGAWGWKVSSEAGSLVCPDFFDLPIDRRVCYIISDSDYRSNDTVRAGFDAFSAYLSSKYPDKQQSKVQFIAVPANGIDKQGADDYFLNGGTLKQLLESGMTPKYFAVEGLRAEQEFHPVSYRSGLVLVQSALEVVPHLIEPLIPEKSITLLAGHSGTLKTWHAIRLMLDGAFGFAWAGHPQLGKPGEPFKSIYVNKEMSGQMMGTRIRQLAKDPAYTRHPDYKKILDENIIVVEEPELNLMEEVQRKRLEALIEETGAALVFLDSMSMCWTGDENSSHEVASFYMQLRGITDRTGVCWILVHHLVKPQSKQRHSPEKHTVRGSGQIVQQADSIVLLSYLDGVDPEKLDPEGSKEIVITHTKARTSVELRSWINTFETNDGLFFSVKYTGLLSEYRAREYVKSHGSSAKFGAWMKTALAGMPAMLPAPVGSGIRFKQLVILLQTSWPEIDGERAPSESTIRRHIDSMVESGDLQMLEESKRNGNLYRFKEEPVVISGEDKVEE